MLLFNFVNYVFLLLLYGFLLLCFFILIVRRNGLVTFCVETAFYNGLLKERYKGGIEVRGRQGRRRRKLLDNLNTLRTGSFELFKRPFPRFLTILTL
jgi:hypothetical protein